MAAESWSPRPDDLLTFVELDEFAGDWQSLGLDVERDLAELQWELMENPASGDLVPGTGGLGKLRFSPLKWRRGKRGAVRVCYAFFPGHFLILLVMAYRKNAKDNLSRTEKQGISRYLAQIETWLDRRKQKK